MTEGRTPQTPPVATLPYPVVATGLSPTLSQPFHRNAKGSGRKRPFYQSPPSEDYRSRVSEMTPLTGIPLLDQVHFQLADQVQHPCPRGCSGQESVYQVHPLEVDQVHLMVRLLRHQGAKIFLRGWFRWTRSTSVCARPDATGLWWNLLTIRSERSDRGRALYSALGG